MRHCNPLETNIDGVGRVESYTCQVQRSVCFCHDLRFGDVKAEGATNA